MSYLDQRMSPTRLWAIVFVALFHVVIGYVFVTGFYQKFTKDGFQDLDVFEVEEPPPPEEEPPPPDEPIPEVQSPEVVAPPPLVRQPQQPQQQVQVVDRQEYVPQTARADTQGEQRPAPTTKGCPGYPGQAFPIQAACPAPPVQEKTCPGGQRVPVNAQCPAPAAPPSPARQTGGSISNADYPASAIRAEASGTTRVSIQVGANGRVAGCSVTGSSGNSALDQTACSLIQRRFRYQPATRGGQPVASTVSRSVTWVLPED
jgi:protein TonB